MNFRSPKCDTLPPLGDEDDCPPIWECPKGHRWSHCEVCRTWFPSKRYHAKTCGPKCRKALSRMERIFEKLMIGAKDEAQPRDSFWRKTDLKSLNQLVVGSNPTGVTK